MIVFGFLKKKKEDKKEKVRTPREEETDRMVKEFLMRGIAVENVRLHTERGICFHAYLPEVKPFKTPITAYDGAMY